MGGIGIITLIPVMADEWSIEFATASLAITFYMIPFVMVQLFSGSIAQLFDVRKTLLFWLYYLCLRRFLMRYLWQPGRFSWKSSGSRDGCSLLLPDHNGPDR